MPVRRLPISVADWSVQVNRLVEMAASLAVTIAIAPSMHHLSWGRGGDRKWQYCFSAMTFSSNECLGVISAVSAMLSFEASWWSQHGDVLPVERQLRR